MKRIWLVAAVCMVCSKWTLAGGGVPWNTPRFFQDPFTEEVAAGRLPTRIIQHHGMYPLLVWLQLSGNYSPEHAELFRKYWDRDWKRDQTMDICSSECYELFMETLRDHGYSIDELKRWRLVVFRETRHGRRFNRAHWIHNCRPDAFRTACLTFMDRKSRYGAGSVELDRWVTAQVAVFRQCADDRGDPLEEPDSRWQSLERHDRRYQIAAWHFYRQNYLDAAERFQEIGETGDSPWRQLARYLAARSLARHAIVNESVEWLAGRRAPSADRARRLEEALAKFERLATDEAYLAEFPSVTNQTMRIRRELNDTGFVGRFEKRFIENPSSVNPRDMRDWLFFAHRLHDVDDRPEEYARWLRDVVEAFGHWSHTHRWFGGYGLDKISNGGFSPEWLEKPSLPYLYLALSVADKNVNQDDLRDLLSRSSDHTQETPGYLPMLVHRLRIACILDDEATIRQLKDELMRQVARVDSMALANKMRFQIARAAFDWREYIQWSSLLHLGQPWKDEFALSLPVSSFNRITSATKLFPQEATRVINVVFTPNMILSVLDVPGLSDYQRGRLAIAGWVKALMADDLDVAVELAGWIEKFFPLLAEAMNRFETANDKRFEAAWIVFHYPAISPWVLPGAGRTHFGGRPVSDRLALGLPLYNWWCANGPNWVEPENPVMPHFARAMDVKSLKTFELPTAAAFFGPYVTRYAEKNLDDPRVPKTLHRVVFATRHACESGPGPVSQRAYAILHKRFPDSEWAKKTPYWYE